MQSLMAMMKAAEDEDDKMWPAYEAAEEGDAESLLRQLIAVPEAIDHQNLYRARRMRTPQDGSCYDGPGSLERTCAR